MPNSISVTMITRDASRFIVESLQALDRFDEVILLDNGSTDDTIALARSFDNVTIHTSTFIGFGPLKNLAVSYAKNEWILSVDSDEVLSEALVDEILSLSLSSREVYTILRDNYYDQRVMRCCGWENDYVLRLFNREKLSFNQNQVHESLVVPPDVKTIRLHHTMKHYTYQNSEQLIAKMQYYSTLWAIDHQGKKRSSPLKAVIRSIFAFVKFYLFKKGFMSGYEGLLICVTNTNAVFYKYMKLYELNKKEKDLDADSY
ncbi:MAG: glycosyltransferase family 2 protein [Campylobacterota bacterium]|nr:glycosyltransferase family 2 protein [Campylobacterota bacterium]